MKLTEAIDSAIYDLIWKKQKMYFKASNGHWMCLPIDQAKRYGIIGLTSYEITHDDVLKIVRMPTNKLVLVE